MKKVLITGASGNLGALARASFCKNSVTLFSRRQLLVSDNETWHRSEDLNNHQWWASFKFEDQYDLVLHFAEPVKAGMDEGEISNIIRSHIGFISSAKNCCGRVIYPLTAYCYDTRIKKRALAYLRIKESVYAALKGENNILFPVFHPLIDYGDGLANLIKIEKNIPLVNLFCSFNACLPVLTRSDIEKFLAGGYQKHTGRVDIYSEIAPVSKLFTMPGRSDDQFISNCFRTLGRASAFIPAIHLLMSGRKIIMPPQDSTS